MKNNGLCNHETTTMRPHGAGTLGMWAPAKGRWGLSDSAQFSGTRTDLVPKTGSWGSLNWKICFDLNEAFLHIQCKNWETYIMITCIVHSVFWNYWSLFYLIKHHVWGILFFICYIVVQSSYSFVIQKKLVIHIPLRTLYQALFNNPSRHMFFVLIGSVLHYYL